MSIEQIARAALDGEALLVRSLVQDLLVSDLALAEIPKPSAKDDKLLATASAILELLAQRAGVEPPEWTAEIGAVSEPIYLVRSALTMRRLRELCERESPEPLRRRRLYAPPDYLAMV